jgi:hypothetical protein
MMRERVGAPSPVWTRWVTWRAGIDPGFTCPAGTPRSIG